MFRPAILWSLWSLHWRFSGDHQTFFGIFAKDWYNIEAICLPGQKGVTLRRQKIHFTTFKKNERKGRGSKMDMEDTSKLKIFTGNSHPALAKEISDYIGVPLGKAICGKFNNGEIQVMINESVRGKDCFIIQPTGAPVNDNLMEMLIMIDALKRASARHITCVVPYYGYARQDRKTRGREPISSKLVADLMSAAGATRVVTMDLHAGQIQGFFNVPVDHLMSASLLADYVKSKNLENLTIVSPDLGGVTRARELADRVGAPIAIIEKRRPEPGVAKVMNIIGDVKDRNCFVVDDIVDTAGSLCEGAKALAEAGARDVYAAVCHPVLTDPATERISKSNIKELIVTNSLPVEKEKVEGLGSKLTQLSIAPLLGEAILRIFHDASVSSLFDK